MPDSISWDVISGPDSGQLVLGVDFPAVRRGQAGFAELAGRIGPQYRFLQTRPPPARSSDDSAAYVARWVEDIRRGRHRVLAVLGYCVGSIYAAATAARIARRQPMPKVILFDPQFASPKYLATEFLREIDAISSLLSDQEIEHIRKAATEISSSAACDVADAVAEMVGIYWDLSSLAFERVGLGSAYNDRLISPFTSYMSWLSVARKIDPTSVWKEATAIVSSDYPELRAGNCADGDDVLIGRQIRFDVAHGDLLRSESVARAVADLLESE